MDGLLNRPAKHRSPTGQGILVYSLVLVMSAMPFIFHHSKKTKTKRNKEKHDLNFILKKDQKDKSNDAKTHQSKHKKQARFPQKKHKGLRYIDCVWEVFNMPVPRA